MAYSLRKIPLNLPHTGLSPNKSVISKTNAVTTVDLLFQGPLGLTFATVVNLVYPRRKFLYEI